MIDIHTIEPRNGYILCEPVDGHPPNVTYMHVRVIKGAPDTTRETC